MELDYIEHVGSVTRIAVVAGDGEWKSASEWVADNYTDEAPDSVVTYDYGYVFTFERFTDCD